MFGSSKISFVVCLLSLSLAGLVQSAPIAEAANLVPRATTSASSVQTTAIVDTASGEMVETCTITLTPEADGTYQEVKSCTYASVSSVATTTAATSTAAETSAAATSAASATATTAAAAAADNDANGAAAASATTASVTVSAVSDAVETFTVPGRHILILPVGLIVFCTLTGIQLLVILIMHFERMKYRRTFRQRKLAEQGAPLGYGGMGKM